MFPIFTWVSLYRLYALPLSCETLIFSDFFSPLSIHEKTGYIKGKFNIGEGIFVIQGNDSSLDSIPLSQTMMPGKIK